MAVLQTNVANKPKIIDERVPMVLVEEANGIDHPADAHGRHLMSPISADQAVCSVGSGLAGLLASLNPYLLQESAVSAGAMSPRITSWMMPSRNPIPLCYCGFMFANCKQIAS